MKRIVIIVAFIFMGMGLPVSIGAQENELIDGLSAMVDDAVGALETIARSGDFVIDMVTLGSVTGAGSVLPVSEGYNALLAVRLARRFGSDGTIVRHLEDGEAPPESGVLLSSSVLPAGNEVLLITEIVRGIDRSVLGGTEMRIEVDSETSELFSARPFVPQPLGSAGEPDDTPDSAMEIGVPDTVSDRQLQIAGDQDWYALRVGDVPASGGGEVMLEVETSGSIDTYLELYGPDTPDSLLAENDDFNGTTSRVTVPVVAGATYYALVRGYADSTTGPYSLSTSFHAVQLDTYEPDNDMDQATPIRIGDTATGHSLGPSDLGDWFHLESVSTDSYDEQVVLSIYTESEMDTVVELYDGLGTIITSDDDSGYNGNAHVFHLLDSTSPLYIYVTGFGDSAEGFYTLVVSTETATLDDYEPDDIVENAWEITLDGQVQSRTFLNNGDVDWLYFTVAEAGTVSIETYGNADTYLSLYDEDLNLLMEDDDGGRDYNARIQRPLTQGRYYIEATPLWGAANVPYEISATLNDR